MNIRSDAERYGSVAIAIHWLTAVIILGLLISGFRADATADSAAKIGILRIHVVGGLAVVTLTIARIIWWLGFERTRPAAIVGTPAWRQRAARAVHIFFYVVIIGMGASGIGMMVLSGAGALLFGSASGPLPDFWQFAPRVPHGIGAFLLAALFALHTAAALHHQFIRRDRILARMGIGA